MWEQKQVTYCNSESSVELVCNVGMLQVSFLFAVVLGVVTELATEGVLYELLCAD